MISDHPTKKGLKEIKGFPDYTYNADTGEIVSRLRRHTVLKLKVPANRHAPYVQMIQDGKRRRISYYRLMYAMQLGISYDEIPDGYYVTINEDGTFAVAAQHEVWEHMTNHIKAARKRERIKRIDERINEMLIMRRYYVSASNVEVVHYIETRHELLVRHYIKKYGASVQNAENVYAQAFEWMLRRIASPESLVMELTLNMMGMMRKVRERYQNERCLALEKSV